MVAIAIKIRDQAHRVAQSLGSGEAEPPQTFFGIASNAIAQDVHESETVLSVRCARVRPLDDTTERLGPNPWGQSNCPWHSKHPSRAELLSYPVRRPLAVAHRAPGLGGISDSESTLHRRGLYRRQFAAGQPSQRGLRLPRRSYRTDNSKPVEIQLPNRLVLRMAATKLQPQTNCLPYGRPLSHQSIVA